jgi:hypothetical protein
MSLFSKKMSRDEVRDKVISMIDPLTSEVVDLSSFLGTNSYDLNDGKYLALSDLQIDRFFSQCEKEFKITIRARSYYAAVTVDELISAIHRTRTVGTGRLG